MQLASRYTCTRSMIVNLISFDLLEVNMVSLMCTVYVVLLLLPQCLE